MDYENPQYIGQYDPKKISERITVSTGFFNIFHRLAPKFSIPVLPQSRVHKRIPLEDQIAAVPSPAPGFWQKTGNGKASNFMENMFIYIYTHHVLVYIYVFCCFNAVYLLYVSYVLCVLYQLYVLHVLDLIVCMCIYIDILYRLCILYVYSEYVYIYTYSMYYIYYIYNTYT